MAASEHSCEIQEAWGGPDGPLVIGREVHTSRVSAIFKLTLVPVDVKHLEATPHRRKHIALQQIWEVTWEPAITIATTQHTSPTT